MKGGFRRALRGSAVRNDAEAENQRKGSFPQGVTCFAVGKSDISQESDSEFTIRSHCPSKEPQLQASSRNQDQEMCLETRSSNELSGLENRLLETPSDTTSITAPEDPRSNSPQACPECGSRRLPKDGIRDTGNGPIQRFLCRNCGYRFSEKGSQGSREPLQKTSKQSLNTSLALGSRRRICALEAKNLVSQAEIKTVCAGTTNQTQDGYIIDFAWKMKKRQLSEATITSRTFWLNALVKLGADLMNPDSVETILATEKMPTPTKLNTVKTYAAFAKAYGVKWEKVKIHYSPKEAFDPLEEEIDVLIAACGRITSAFLQVAKDTGARVGEIKRIEYTDIDEKQGTIAINHPEKGSRTRIVKVSTKTLVAIKNLPKKYGAYIFNPHSVSERYSFSIVRKRVAERTQNPRLLKIHFHTLRHWRASREYEKSGDIYAVKTLLGHKSIISTDRYQHGTFASEEYIIKRPQTSQEEDTLMSAGFEFVRFDHKENVPVLRKRK